MRRRLERGDGKRQNDTLFPSIHCPRVCCRPALTWGGSKGQEEEEWKPPEPPLLLFWGQFWDWGTRGGKRNSLSHLPPHCQVYQYDLIGKSVALRCEELNNKFDCEKEPWGAEVTIEGHTKGKQHRRRKASREEALMGWEGRRGAGRSSDWRERQKVRACAHQLVGRTEGCRRILCCTDRIFSVRANEVTWWERAAGEQGGRGCFRKAIQV